MTENKGKVWIDLDNSPHVPFFKPIIEELDRRGYSSVITARDCFQVCGLADMLKVPYKRIGRHYGKNKIIKLLGLMFRAMQMAPTIMGEKPVLALSHGSRSQVILAKILRIPSVVIFDYEHARGLFFAHPDSVIVPEVIPDSSIKLHCAHIGRYPGIKEDVYVPEFIPTPGILQELGIEDGEIVVTMRPPATEAHYHMPESDQLFGAIMERLAKTPLIRVVLLPRNDAQAADIRQKWPEQFSTGKMIIPEHVVDGLNLIWHSDLVISGGGTMNREAAALGVPVYSIFRGTTGIVDKYLATTGRLILVESVEDVGSKIVLEKWNRPAEPDHAVRPALQQIVHEVESLIGRAPVKASERVA